MSETNLRIPFYSGAIGVAFGAAARYVCSPGSPLGIILPVAYGIVCGVYGGAKKAMSMTEEEKNHGAEKILDAGAFNFAAGAGGFFAGWVLEGSVLNAIEAHQQAAQIAAAAKDLTTATNNEAAASNSLSAAANNLSAAANNLTAAGNLGTSTVQQTGVGCGGVWTDILGNSHYLGTLIADPNGNLVCSANHIYYTYNGLFYDNGNPICSVWGQGWEQFHACGIVGENYVSSGYNFLNNGLTYGSNWACNQYTCWANAVSTYTPPVISPSNYEPTKASTYTAPIVDSGKTVVCAAGEVLRKGVCEPIRTTCQVGYTYMNGGCVRNLCSAGARC